jgi:AcrR family transcriptional regulator
MMQKSRTPSLQIGPEVLRSALAILDDEGPDGFTVRAIAEQAGVAPMAIYNHFDGVNGVIDALWTRGFELLGQAVTFHTDNVEDDFISAGLGYRRFALENRGLYTVMFLHQFRNFEPSVAGIQIAAQTYHALFTVVERCRAAGLFDRSTASDAAQVIWSACHGYVSLELRDMNFARDADYTYATLLATLRSGLR